MKSTGQAPKHRTFPLTDYNYLPTAETRTGSGPGRPARKLPAFYRLSHEFFGAEAFRDYVAEFSLFTVIAVVTTWPILSMLVAVTRLARNY
jgi:hypothetical protein